MSANTLHNEIDRLRRVIKHDQECFAAKDAEIAALRADVARLREALRLAGPQFPLQKQDGIPAGTVPLWIAAAAYHSYQEAYGSGQTLQRMGERGGFGAAELLALLMSRSQYGPGEPEFDRVKHLLATARAAIAAQPAPTSLTGITVKTADIDGLLIVGANGSAVAVPLDKPAPASDGGK